MHASATLTRWVLLLAALCVAAGPLSGSLVALACADVCCCCGPSPDAAADDCGCEVEAPPEPQPAEPLAAPGVVHAATTELALEAAVEAGPWQELSAGPRWSAWGRDRAPPPRPPARLLHCSLTI